MPSFPTKNQTTSSNDAVELMAWLVTAMMVPRDP